MPKRAVHARRLGRSARHFGGDDRCFARRTRDTAERAFQHGYPQRGFDPRPAGVVKRRMSGNGQHPVNSTNPTEGTTTMRAMS